MRENEGCRHTSLQQFGPVDVGIGASLMGTSMEKAGLVVLKQEGLELVKRCCFWHGGWGGEKHERRLRAVTEHAVFGEESLSEQGILILLIGD